MRARTSLAVLLTVAAILLATVLLRPPDELPPVIPAGDLAHPNSSSNQLPTGSTSSSRPGRRDALPAATARYIRVTDEDGNPIEGATVELLDRPGNTVARSLTPTSGALDLRDGAPPMSGVLVTKTGFFPKAQARLVESPTITLRRTHDLLIDLVNAPANFCRDWRPQANLTYPKRMALAVALGHPGVHGRFRDVEVSTTIESDRTHLPVPLDALGALEIQVHPHGAGKPIRLTTRTIDRGTRTVRIDLSKYERLSRLHRFAVIHELPPTFGRVTAAVLLPNKGARHVGTEVSTGYGSPAASTRHDFSALEADSYTLETTTQNEGVLWTMLFHNIVVPGNGVAVVRISDDRTHLRILGPVPSHTVELPKITVTQVGAKEGEADVALRWNGERELILAGLAAGNYVAHGSTDGAFATVQFAVVAGQTNRFDLVFKPVTRTTVSIKFPSWPKGAK